jgi:hypothetical protein
MVLKAHLCTNLRKAGICRAAKFVRMGGGHGDDRVNALGWEPLESRRRKARLRALFKAYLGHKAWVDIKRRLYMPTYYGRGDHSFKIKLRQQRTDVGKFSFLNRTIVDWNQLPAAAFEGSPLNLCRFKRNLRKL